MIMKTFVAMNCLVCDVEIVYRFYKSNPWRLYCSRKCNGIPHRELVGKRNPNWKGGKLVKCGRAKCANTFYLNPSAKGVRRCCSHECMGLFRAGKSMEQFFGTEKATHLRAEQSRRQLKRYDKEGGPSDVTKKRIGRGVTKAWKALPEDEKVLRKQATSKGVRRALRRGSAALDAEYAKRKTPEYRESQRERQRAVAQRPDQIYRREQLNADPEYRAHLSLGQTLSWREGRRIYKAPPVRRVGAFELALLPELKRCGYDFKHQYRVPGTRYHADFYLPTFRIIAEVDGHQSHYQDPKRIRHDKRRDARLHRLGYHIVHLRLWKIHGRLEVKLAKCLTKIQKMVETVKSSKIK